ncbi:proton-coupled folate transporter-like isoform X1 [Macrosteles quadrilineatus]|uniref:proton-coupled folate transporter-like isoform X1 n=1 Tax=Macrosteles quadrilineatus TaxID=74068 RepID=UPI0023E2A2C6|nr:proton-coupled folate transporter-like isoform X1 [Macrosteles quadrilineatus]
MHCESLFSNTKVFLFLDERSELLSSTKSAQALSETKSTPQNQSTSQIKWSNVIEPVMFLYLVAKALSDTVITNLLENRTCLVELNLPDHNCTEPISATIEDLIQPSTADVIMARALVESLIPSLLTLLVGPWSDINGRKPFLVIALAGQMISYLTWGCLALLHGINPPTFLFASLPISLTGGSPIIFLLVYCYITDITDDHSRPFRLSLLTLAIFTSSIVGIAFAPVIVAVQDTLNPYPLVFFISTTILAVTVIYTIFVIRETVDVLPDRDSCLFEMSHLTHMAVACFSKREGRARFMILAIIACLSINVFINEGEGAILYLSAREMFSWSLSDYTIFLCVNCIAGPGSVVGVWLSTSLLGLSNMQAASVTLATRLIRSPVMALATAGWHFYLANLVCFFSCAYAPLVRSELGRLVPREDLGKIFALTAFLESMTTVPATPLYTTVYTATYLYAPGIVYWLSAGFTVMAVILLTSVVIAQRTVNGACYVTRTHSNYARIHE